MGSLDERRNITNKEYNDIIKKLCCLREDLNNFHPGGVSPTSSFFDADGLIVGNPDLNNFISTVTGITNSIGVSGVAPDKIDSFLAKNFRLKAAESRTSDNLLVYGSTTDNTPTELTLNATDEYSLVANKIFFATVYVTGLQSGGIAGTVGDGYVQTFKGAFKNIGGVVSQFGGLVCETIAIDTAAEGWEVCVYADDTTDELRVTVKGETDKSIEWMASIVITENGY